MNDTELMKKIYDRRCADEMTAAEILEGSTEPARVRSRAPVLAAAAAAAVALGVGTALFVKYKAAPTAAGEPSAGQAEDITPIGSAADTSSDPWEPGAVSMPDPFKQEGMIPVTDYSETESRDVIEYMESTEDGADSSRSEQPVPKSDRMKPAVFVWNDQTKADGFGDEYFDFNAFSGTFTLDAFPGVEFKWEKDCITVTENGKVIDIQDYEPKDHLYGMPIWNAYFTDLNGDSYPELCVTASDGSGVIDTYIYVYDHRNRKNYSLRDRMRYNYVLLMEGEELTVRKTPYNWGNDWEKLSRETVFGSLAIENDELVFKED